MVVAEIATHKPQERTCIATYIISSNTQQHTPGGAVEHITTWYDKYNLRERQRCHNQIHMTRQLRVYTVRS